MKLILDRKLFQGINELIMAAQIVIATIRAHIRIRIALEVCSNQLTIKNFQFLRPVKHFNHMPAEFSFYQMGGEEFATEADFIKCRYHLTSFELA